MYNLYLYIIVEPENALIQAETCSSNYGFYKQVSILTDFLKSLLTSIFHYKIAILNAKSFLLQSIVTLINTVYIHLITEPRFVFKVPFTKCPNISFLLLKIFC
jgi:hypothetical protein